MKIKYVHFTGKEKGRSLLNSTTMKILETGKISEMGFWLGFGGGVFLVGGWGLFIYLFIKSLFFFFKRWVWTS